MDKRDILRDPIVDMNFFEVPGFRHYRGSPVADDKRLRELYVDRVCDTYIDEEQMVFAEATSVLPLMASHAYHQRLWQPRPERPWSRIFEPALAGEHQ
jgi:deoxyhypusine synthase